MSMRVLTTMMTYKKVLYALFFLCVTFTSAVFASTANWMSEIPNDRIMNQLIIPGTHDSGSYAITSFSKFSLTHDDPLPMWIEEISNILPISLVRMIVAGWSKTQPYSIADQLNNGIRYLDFRVCHDTDSHLYLCHALLSVRLNHALHQIQTFISQNPSEIILLDINHIYNINNSNDEAQLISLIQGYLGNIAVPNSYHANDTIGTIRQSNRNVIILMNTDQPVTDPALQKFVSTMLWHESNIDSPWPNVSTTSALKSILDTQMAARAKIYASANNFFVLQVIKTENTDQVIDGIVNAWQYPNTIKRYEISVNQAFNNWLNGYIDLYGQQPMNIVIHDWFDHTWNLIPLAIQYDTQSLSYQSQPRHHDEKLDELSAWYQR